MGNLLIFQDPIVEAVIVVFPVFCSVKSEIGLLLCIVDFLYIAVASSKIYHS